MNKFFTKFAANAAVKRAGIVAIGCIGLGLFAVPSAHGQFDTACHHGVSDDNEHDYAVRDGGAASDHATSQL